eukprot:gene24520-biopygen10074
MKRGRDQGRVNGWAASVSARFRLNECCDATNPGTSPHFRDSIGIVCIVGEASQDIVKDPRADKLQPNAHIASWHFLAGTVMKPLTAFDF